MLRYRKLRLIIKIIFAFNLFLVTYAFGKTNINLSNWKTYKNQKYQFIIKYPAKFKASHQFSRTYLLGSSWSTGSSISENNDHQHSIVEIPLANISYQKDNAYYYQAFVRVGASDDPKDIKHCQSANNVYLQHPFKKYEMINGKKFFVFNFSEAAMSQLNSGVSYRIIYHDFCYAIEFVETAGNIAAMPDYSKISKNNQRLGKKIIATFEFK